MKDYRAYNLRDFLQDDGFRDWVQGKGGAEESFWHSFRLRYPEKTGTLKQAEIIIRAAGHGNSSITGKEIRTEVETFLERITADEKDGAVVPEPAGRPYHAAGWLPWLIAAGISVFVVSGYFMRDKTALPNETSAVAPVIPNLVKTSNDTDKPLRIVLSDNSEVLLSPNSSLRYPAHFADTSRIVYLAGEADFSIQKGESPFMVYAGDVVTKVLGTRFVVKAFEKDRNTTVQVHNGTVSVFKKEKRHAERCIAENDGLIITANQAAVFEKSIRQLTKTLVSDPVKLAKAPDIESKRYDEVSLSKILVDLESAYGIAILFDQEQFERCKITATLADENMYQKLEMLCKSIGATYEIVDGRILILGKGC